MLTIYEQIQEAIDLVEAHLSEEITATAGARSAGMSLRSFHRYFPALTGYRFGEYVRKRRLSVAMDDLRMTQASILEIALGSGYVMRPSREPSKGSSVSAHASSVRTASRHDESARST